MNKLNELVKIASLESPYYRRTFPQKEYFSLNDFAQLPIIERKTIVDNSSEILIDKYQGLLSQSLLVNLTSGTSGKPLEIYWEPNDSIRSHLSLWRRRSLYYNIMPTDKYCCLHTTAYSRTRVSAIEKYIISEDGKNLSLCKMYQDEESLLEYYDLIKKFKPVWLFIQPSFLKRLMYVINNFSLEKIHSIKYIELAGETVLESDKNFINSYWCCPVANMYGSMETNGIAYECPNHHMHILTNNVYLEAINFDKKTGIGDAVITSLTNRAFPIIRYNIGDRIILNNSKISCKYSNEPIVKEIIGRSEAKIEMYDGNTISEYIMAYCIERAIAIIGNFAIEYRVKKFCNQGVVVIIHLDNNFEKWKNEIKRLILDLIMKFYPNYSFEIEYVDSMFEVSESGKRYILEV